MESVSAVNVSVPTFSPCFTRSSLSIPEDLVCEIFSRLPTKAIARCRCLSKLWASMLSSQYLTELFLTISSARPQLLFVFETGREIVLFSSPQPENPEENSYVVAANHLASFPSSYGFSAPTSGFFCYKVEQNFEGMKVPEFVPVICNPSTGQSFTLPRFSSTKMYGFESYLGYDPIAKEFKVLSMEHSVASGEVISVKHQVLTLGTNKSSWRMVECSIPHFCSHKRICISGVIYYEIHKWSSVRSTVGCFDLRSEKFSLVNLNRTMPHSSTTLVNYNGKLGLLMFEDSGDISRPSKSLELWVLRDAAKHEWTKHVYVLPPPLWEDRVDRHMQIAGMVGVNEVVLTQAWFRNVPFWVIYYNVERKTITKVVIQGMEAFRGKSFHTYLNYVENVKLI